MKTYVIDASTSLKWIFEEEGSVEARKYLNDFLSKKIKLVAPSLWLVEVANAIKSAVLSKRITRKKGETLLDLLLKVNLKIVNTDVLTKKAYQNACKYQISVYDSVYLTLTRENKIELITSDKKLQIPKTY